jgi:hypothetical protein
MDERDSDQVSKVLPAGKCVRGHTSMVERSRPSASRRGVSARDISGASAGPGGERQLFDVLAHSRRNLRSGAMTLWRMFTEQ